MVCVHNGIDCRAAVNCDWEECVEFCHGDHFLGQVLLWLPASPCTLAAPPVMPNAWLVGSRWDAGLKCAADALEDLVDRVSYLFL